jgi:hypothetical protein
MNPSYDLFQTRAQTNKNLYTLLRFACRCDHTSAFTKDEDSIITFLAAKNKKINIFNYGDKPIDVSSLQPIANELDSELTIANGYDSFSETELLYIDTIGEGNLKALELKKYSDNVKKYIIIPNTFKYAHAPESNPGLPIDKKIGMNFGINHFLSTNHDWFILEHDDLDPGITVFVNRKNVDAY